MFTIEYDDHGSFRIVAPDGTKGEWTLYQHMAVLRWNNERYIAATQYGLLDDVGKPEKVYKLSDMIPTKTKAVKGHRPK